MDGIKPPQPRKKIIKTSSHSTQTKNPNTPKATKTVAATQPSTTTLNQIEPINSGGSRILLRLVICLAILMPLVAIVTYFVVNGSDMSSFDPIVDSFKK